MGSLSNFFKGQRERTGKIQRFTPEQQSAISQALQMALSGLMNPMEGFQPIQEDIMAQFYGDVIPTLAERFGGVGALGSSAFEGALRRAESGLGRTLASEGAKFGQQSRALSTQLLGTGLQPSFESYFRPAAPGFLQTSGSNILNRLIGKILPF